MSDELDNDAALAREGVQAFNAMTAAMDRLGATLVRVDERQLSRRFREDQESSTALLAALEVKKAAETALRAAEASARHVAAWAVLSALAGVLVAGAAGYWIGQSSGWQAGQAAGYAAAMDQKTAAAWANTPSGKLALALDQNGSLAMLATCNNPGWTVEARAGRRLCFVNSAPDGKNYGWTLP